MTTFVCRMDNGFRYLWADTDGERETMLSIIGPAPRSPEQMSWVRHEITEAQLTLAVACGATLTDHWGPAFWRAQRYGDERTIAIITTARTFAK